MQLNSTVSIGCNSMPICYCMELYPPLKMMLNQTKLWLVTLHVSQTTSSWLSGWSLAKWS